MIEDEIQNEMSVILFVLNLCRSENFLKKQCFFVSVA